MKLYTVDWIIYSNFPQKGTDIVSSKKTCDIIVQKIKDSFKRECKDWNIVENPYSISAINDQGEYRAVSIIVNESELNPINSSYGFKI